MKLLLENWRKFINENYSQKLKYLRDSDQELRNKWAAKMDKGGGYSKELAAEFAEEHGTTTDDLFNDAPKLGLDEWSPQPGLEDIKDFMDLASIQQ